MQYSHVCVCWDAVHSRMWMKTCSTVTYVYAEMQYSHVCVCRDAVQSRMCMQTCSTVTYVYAEIQYSHVCVCRDTVQSRMCMQRCSAVTYEYAEIQYSHVWVCRDTVQSRMSMQRCSTVTYEYADMQYSLWVYKISQWIIRLAGLQLHSLGLPNIVRASTSSGERNVCLSRYRRSHRGSSFEKAVYAKNFIVCFSSRIILLIHFI
jgi:hypothetical protein